VQPGSGKCGDPLTHLPLERGLQGLRLGLTSPPLLHTKSDLPYTSLIQTSSANVNVLLALYRAACWYNHWSRSAPAAHTCWCSHIPCNKLATTDQSQKPDLTPLWESPSFPQIHSPRSQTLAKSTENLSAKGINISTFAPLLASLEDLMWQGLFAILGMQNKPEKGSLSFTFFRPPTITDGSGVKLRSRSAPCKASH